MSKWYVLENFKTLVSNLFLSTSSHLLDSYITVTIFEIFYHKTTKIKKFLTNTEKVISSILIIIFISTLKAEIQDLIMNFRKVR